MIMNRKVMAARNQFGTKLLFLMRFREEKHKLSYNKYLFVSEWIQLHVFLVTFQSSVFT